MKISSMRGRSGSMTLLYCRRGAHEVTIARMTEVENTSSRFGVGDRVVVVGAASANCFLVGTIIEIRTQRTVYFIPHKAELWYTVEFNRVSRHRYRESELALAPIPIAA